MQLERPAGLTAPDYESGLVQICIRERANTVANGSFIVAAVHTGFRYKAYNDDFGYEDVNVAFNMSQTSLDDALYRFLGSRGLTEQRMQRAARRLAGHGAAVDNQQATSTT